MDITIDEVQRFLDEFKVKASVFGIIYRDDRNKNMESLVKLGISAKIREKIIFSLEGEDYSEGPLMDTLNKGNALWVFGKDHEGTELYIKITVIPHRALCISFHEAEHPMKYPFKTKKK